MKTDTMSVENHTDKAKLILDNTKGLYDREQAIFKVYFNSGNKAVYMRQLKELADSVISATNQSETADPVMHGATAEEVAKNIVEYMLGDYDEFTDYQPDAHAVHYTELSGEKRLLYIGSANGCFYYIFKAQGQSVDYAIKHGGYSILPTKEDEKIT